MYIYWKYLMNKETPSWSYAKQKHCLCLDSGWEGGKNHVQAPSIDFQCSLTVLAALRAEILFVPLPHTLVPLLLSESTWSGSRIMQRTDLRIISGGRSHCMSECSFFKNFVSTCLSGFPFIFNCMMDVLVCWWLMGHGLFLCDTQGGLM